MANTLTGLIPDLYAGLDVVSRELVGFAPAVGRNFSADRAAVGQNITYHVAPAGNVGNVTPAMAVPNTTDQAIAAPTMTISKSRFSEFGFTGEEQKGLNTGPGYPSVQADIFAQSLRALINELETDVAVAAAAGASRAYVATNLFSANTDGISGVNKILLDNGAPLSDKHLIVDTTAGASLRTLYAINDDRDWSRVPMSQQGVLISPHGIATRESAQIVSHTKGTAANSTTDAAGYAVGDTTITLASAGTGTIVAGDIVQFDGDTNWYVVVTGDADVSGGGSIVIAEPGLRVAIVGATAITVGASYSANVAFFRGAIQLATRAPALPQEGDLAIDRMMLTDPRSGITFEVATYPGYRKVRYEVSLAWGFKVTQSRHVALLVNNPS